MWLTGLSLLCQEAYHNVSSACPKLIRSGWDEITSLGKESSGRARLKAELGLCEPPAGAEAAADLIGWIEDGIETMVQYGCECATRAALCSQACSALDLLDLLSCPLAPLGALSRLSWQAVLSAADPYPTSFYNPVPGYPFKVACERMVKSNTPLGALRAAIDVYYNFTGAAGACFDPDGAATSSGVSSRRVRSGSGFDGQRGWGYQTCTEVYQPMQAPPHPRLHSHRQARTD